MSTSPVRPLVLLVLATVAVASACLAQVPLTDLPPRVADCNPKPFATNVDAALKQITLTFDRPMTAANRASLASLRFMGLFPCTPNTQGSWDATGTILTIPVTLDTDLTYALTLNCSKDRGTTDAKGVPALAFSWVFATGPRTPEDFPAYVVKCDPPQGARDVDFGRKQISVTFSRPVSPWDYSGVILRGSGDYPAGRDARPPTLSADRLTATFDARLSPDTVYALEVNDVAYFGFKDTRGRPVLPFGWCFKTQK
jgi:hypothetical protein